jgi:LysM repeat protein
VKGIKNAAVVTLMMGVLYAVYVTLSKPDPPLPAGFEAADVAALGPPQIDFGGPVEMSPAPAPGPQMEIPAVATPDQTAAAPAGNAAPDPFSKFNKAPQLAPAPRARGGGYAADAGNVAPADPPDVNIQTPDQVASSNPANSEVPLVPEIPPAEPAAAEPTPAYQPRGGRSVYGGGNYAEEATPTTPSSAPLSASPALAPPLETPNVANANVDTTAYAAPPPATRNPALTLYSLKQDWQQAQQAVADGKFVDALKLLSKYHNHPDLEPGDQNQVNKWLDALAGKVIYSTEHLLAEPHKVGSQESLFDVAERCNVPWQLLQNINGVRDPEVLVPGTTLKVVPGPFRATADLARGELTLFLGEMYAGRFPFAVGNDTPQPGEYRVGDKRRDRVYIGGDQRVINGSDPDNPYGGWWLDLGREASIHGSPKNLASGQTLGCISLSPQDAKDVYGILSLGSTVTIKR